MKYDCIVIGAGNGGLTAALTLQKAGKKVLVLENHNLPGGFASSFIRGRFEFEASLHELCEYGTEVEHGDLYNLFQRLGITNKIEFVKVPESFHVITLDTKEEYTFPSGVESFISKMEEYVPGSQTAMTDFFVLAKEVKYALAYLKETQNEPNEAVMNREYANFMRVAPYSLNKVLEKLKLPKKAQEILTSYWIQLGSPSKDLSFVHYVSLLNAYIEFGAWVPKLRSHEISTLLVNEFENLGGKIQFLTKVTEIIMEEEKIIGVKCADKKEFFADYIISNVSPNVFYGSLMPKERVPKFANKLINSRTLGARGFSVYLGLNKSALELGLKNYSYFIYHSLDSNQEYRHMKELYHESSIATVLNNAISNCSPEGTCEILLTTLYFDDIFSKSAREDNYVNLKNQIALKLIEAFERATGVNILENIEEIEIATPLTYARYGGHPEGVIYGYMAKGYDNLIPRLMREKEEDFLPNVFFCGGFSSQLSGFSSSYFSGEIAALKVLNKNNNEEVSHEGN